MGAMGETGAGGDDTCVSVAGDHVEDGVAGVVAGGGERVWAEAGEELLDVLGVAVSAGEEEVVEVVGVGRGERHGRAE